MTTSSKVTCVRLWMEWILSQRSFRPIAGTEVEDDERNLDPNTMAGPRRIARELTTMNKTPIEGVTVTPAEDNMRLWNVVITGPPDSPYAKGTFKVKIEFPEEFPFKAPSLTFQTKVYHPGINDEGQICVPVLSDQWKPTVTIQSVLQTVYEKLANPSPDEPYEADIAALLKSDKAKFQSNAKEWTKKYAT